MFSFLLGLCAGSVCVLNPAGTRRLLATILVKGEKLVEATSQEGLRWASQVKEEVEDIVAEAQASRNQPQ